MALMWLPFLCFRLLLTEGAQYHQNDYTVKLERVEILGYNKSYTTNPTCDLAYYNRTCRGIKARAYLLKDLGMNIKGLFEMNYGAINYSLLPPYIPGGRYKADIRIFDDSNFVFGLSYLATVEEIIKKWEY